MTNVTTQWIISEMENWAPTSLAESYDNVGLLVGDASIPIKKILVALDATEAVINEAILGEYNCIITHHPLIRDPLKNITTADATGRKIISLVKRNICLYTAHTNLDKAQGGVGDCLAEKIFDKKSLPALVKEPFSDFIGFGRIITLEEEISFGELLNHVKSVLDLGHVSYSGDISTKIKKVGMCGGSGMNFWQTAKDESCDAYITGDVKHHDALNALDAGLSLIDITHYSGENVIVNTIVSRLRAIAKQNWLDLEINATSVDGQTLYTL